MTDYYPQLDVPALLVLLDGLQKRGTTGQVFFTTGAGIQSQRSFQGSAPVSVEIKRVLYSLFLRDPDTYKNPFANRIRMTRTHYVADSPGPIVSEQ